jgi:hypothetical protein
MARFPLNLSGKLRSRSKDANEKDPNFIVDSPPEYPPEKVEADRRLTARFGFAETPEQSLDSILDSYVNAADEYHPKQYNESSSSGMPNFDEETLATLESGNRFSSTSPHSPHSTSPSRQRRSIVTIATKRRSLSEMMCEAASTGDVPQIGRLLGAGADPKKKSKNGLLPVHLAAAGGHLGVLKSLAMHGAPMDAVDQHSRTPLHAAVMGRQATVIPFLVNAGVPLDAKDADGCTAMQLATQMEAEDAPETFDVENPQNNKVRFSYVFGASKAEERASISSVPSIRHTPLEVLRRAGADSVNLRVEARL